MPLNDRQIKNAKPSDKIQKLSDGGGLCLVVHPNGGKYWQLNFRFDGKQKTLSIGTYPTIALTQARAARETAKQQIAQGIDPAAAKQQQKTERAAARANTFHAIAAQWHEKQTPKWKPNHAARVWHGLEMDVFPQIGGLPIDKIGVQDVKAVLDKIAERGALVTAKKIREWIGAVFKYAAMLELTDRNPAAVLSGYLAQNEVINMPALPRERLPEFYSRLLSTPAERQNIIGVLLIMLVFVRNHELRGGLWCEVDFQAATWTIPAERMKRPRPHIIPLSDWAVELLRELHGITGHTPFMFPSSSSKSGYISENTLGKIINTMGYKGIATPHGFRSLASSVLNEQGFNPDSIERQLAHIDENKVRAAYNRAEYWHERVEFMQWYSDYLKSYYPTEN